MFIEGELEPPAAEIVRIHLGTCGRCRAAVARYKQLLWDLEHPLEPPLPRELESLHQRLVAAWADQQREAALRSRGRRLVPAWAGYSLLWTRHLPAADRVSRFLTRTGRRLVASRLPVLRYVWPRRR